MYDEVRDWIREFWAARRDYEWCKTRSVTGSARASKRIGIAIDRLIEFGAIKEGNRMPTLDEYDRKKKS